MSDLENEAKTVLTPLIKGQGQPLTQQDQKLIATWTSKTALMYELGNIAPTNDITPPASRRFLYEHQEPPPVTYVWIAAYDGPRTLWVEQHKLALKETSQSGAGLGTTMTFGHLLLQALSIWNYPDEVELQGGPGLPRLWPDPRSGPFTLPSFSDAETQILAKRFLTS